MGKRTSSSPSDRAAFARTFVHTALAMLPDLSPSEMFCVVMDDRDRLSRLVGRAIANAAEEEFEQQLVEHARPAPQSVILALRRDLGAALVRDLEAALPPRTMRVLWLTPGQHHVMEVQIEDVLIERARQNLEGREVDRDAPGEREVREVRGTWMDPERYLPNPIPAAWSIEGVDDTGVLRLTIDGSWVVEMGAMSPTEDQLLFVVFRRRDDGADVDDRRAKAILDRMRNVRGGFKELPGVADIFGESRVYASRVTPLIPRRLDS